MKRNKGISLIVLVITIIVMIILAGSIILSLSNNGIIGKANEAVDASNFKQFEQYLTSELLLNGYHEGKVIKRSDLELIKDINIIDLKSAGKDVPDTWVVEKDGTKVTVYATGDILKGEVELWDGTSSAPEIKDGNWYIYTPSQLKFLADVVNGVNQTEGYKITGDTIVYLMNDLDLGARQIDGELKCGNAWTQIGITKPEEGKSFVGTFEGNNHTIRGVYISAEQKYVGIFGNSNTIQNLTIKDSYIKSTNSCVGGIVGALRSGSVENCHNINTTVEGLYSVGGVVGQFVGNDMINCSNSATISVDNSVENSSQAGGVCGRFTGEIFKECNNTGEVIATGECIGGVVGRLVSAVTFSDCTNRGNVTSNAQTDAYTYVGGIIGAGSSVETFKNSSNTGSVVSSGAYVGGIVGYMDDYQTVENCRNTGNVTGARYTGGIVGAAMAGKSNNSINNCFNKGKINGQSESTGGIVGYLSAGNVSDCNNEGNVSGKKKWTGGIAGWAHGASSLKKCFNKGTVIGEGSRIGGVIGEISGPIELCVNSGTIQGYGSAIGGVCGTLFSTMKQCYNEGTIKINEGTISELAGIGGVCGIMGTTNTQTITNTYNKGNIIIERNDIQNIGGIVGIMADNGKATMTNNYNIGKITILGNNVNNVGGVLGYIEQNNDYTKHNNYYLDTTLNVAGNAYGESKTSEQMKLPAFVTELNTGLEAAAWEIRTGENNGYPVLIK